MILARVIEMLKGIKAAALVAIVIELKFLFAAPMGITQVVFDGPAVGF